MKLSAPSRQKPAPAHYADVQVELTRMVFKGLLLTIVIGGIALVGATAILSWHYHDRFLEWLAGAMLVACSARAFLAHLFLKHADADLSVRAANLWELAYGFMTFAYCGMMALSTIWNFFYHDYVGQLWCVLGTSVLCAAFSAGLSLRPWIARTAGMILLIAFSVSVAHSHDPLVRLTTVLVLLYGFQYSRAVQLKFDIIVEGIRTKRQLRELSEHDPLTGLANRRHFESVLKRACDQAAPFALLYLDLDGFKGVNDTYGHAAGDKLLCSVADRLRTSVRQSDIIARLGGDEFAVLQSAPTSESAARSLAMRLSREIALPFAVDGCSMQIGASVGIRLKGEEAVGSNTLLMSADAAMYEAKKRRRGEFTMAGDLPSDKGLDSGYGSPAPLRAVL